MARCQKGPWQRGGKGPWYTTIGRDTVRVADADESFATAFKKMVEILADAGDMPAEQITVRNLFRRFLPWTQANRSESTYAFYQRYLTAFEKVHGTKRVAKLLPRHVEHWVQSDFSHCSCTTQNGIMKALDRAMNWAVQKRYIKHNPLVGMEKPSRVPRETVLTANQFRKLLSLVPDTEFRITCSPAEYRLASDGDSDY